MERAEAGINDDLERLIGQPLTSAGEWRAAEHLEVRAEDALQFAITNATRLAMVTVAVRTISEELLSGSVP